MVLFDIAWIRQRTLANEFYLSQHGDQERQNDNLTLSDVRDALISGIIVEEYEDSGRGTSCLVAGFSHLGIPIHAVCGKRGKWLVIVTVYIPKPPKFKNIYERG